MRSGGSLLLVPVQRPSVWLFYMDSYVVGSCATFNIKTYDYEAPVDIVISLTHDSTVSFYNIHIDSPECTHTIELPHEKGEYIVKLVQGLVELYNTKSITLI